MIFPQKYCFPRKKGVFRKKAGNVPKRYRFCFKNMLQINVVGSFLAPGPQEAQNELILVDFTKLMDF